MLLWSGGKTLLAKRLKKDNDTLPTGYLRTHAAVEKCGLTREGVDAIAGYPGKQGRKPKATTIVERQQQTINDDLVPKRMPPPPDHFTETEKAEWKRIGKFLLDAGLITKLDLNVLEAYCRTYVRWVEAEEQVRRYGTVIKSPNGYPIQSPYLSIANKALEQMKSLMGELGLTPASRVRIPKQTPRSAKPPAAPRVEQPQADVAGDDPRRSLRRVK